MWLIAAALSTLMTAPPDAKRVDVVRISNGNIVEMLAGAHVGDGCGPRATSRRSQTLKRLDLSLTYVPIAASSG